MEQFIAPHCGIALPSALFIMIKEKTQYSGVIPWDDSTETRTIHMIFTPYAGFNAFAKPDKAKLIIHNLEEAAKRHSIILHEVCAMPDHVHVLVSFDRSRHMEKDISKKLKGASAHAFLKDLSATQAHLWGKRMKFVPVESENQFRTVVKYIQNNPIKGNIPPCGRVLSVERLEFIQSNNKSDE